MQTYFIKVKNPFVDKYWDSFLGNMEMFVFKAVFITDGHIISKERSYK